MNKDITLHASPFHTLSSFEIRAHFCSPFRWNLRGCLSSDFDFVDTNALSVLYSFGNSLYLTTLSLTFVTKKGGNEEGKRFIGEQFN